MTEKTAPNIHQRVNAVMKDVDYVKKDRQVSGGGQNYKAVTHDQVVATIRGAMVKHGITVYPEQINSEMLVMRDPKQDIKMHLYSGNYCVHFVNIDNPDDRVSLTINAHANDNGDKAPGKCATYAVKTAVLKVFFLETGEDDEGRMEGTKPITELQAKAIRNALDGDDKRIAAFCAAYEIEAVEALPKGEYDTATARIKKSNERVQ